jgi:hypothetical protein
VKVPLGLGGLRMSIDFEKMEEREPEFAKLHAKGNGVGAVMNMDTSFSLSDAGSGTNMQWEADVHILGPVASMGQRVLQPIVNQQVAHVLTALDKQVQEAIANGAADSEGPKDYGEPADADTEAGAPAGSSGADEGVSPLSPEAYEPDPEGPTTSTEDKG